MAQDIRELLKQDRSLPTERLRAGHEDRFMAMLEKEFPVEKKKPDFNWLKIAASVVVIFSISFTAMKWYPEGEQTRQEIVNAEEKTLPSTVIKKQSHLANISPEYEKTENYFLTSINFELSQIEVNENNKELVDSFKVRLEKLNKEYERLNTELVEFGPNELSIEAMIENLQMRLELLKKLKDKLKEIEHLSNEEYYQEQTT